MCKSLKMLKKIIMYVLVMCIVGIFCSNAAIVSDNDGSAFVTKAEFDALKADYNSQINNYNVSIDSKIDGAIASYLAGVQISKTTPYELPNAWNDVYFLNGSIAPTFRVPELDVVYSYTGESAVAVKNLKQFVVSGRDKNEFKWGTNETCLRPLFGVLSGTESDPDNVVMYWRGIAQRYHEKYDIIWSRADEYNDLAQLDAHPGYCSAKITDAYKISATGYFAFLSNNAAFYAPSAKFRLSADGVSYSEIDVKKNYVFGTLVFPIVSFDEINGKTTDFDHVVQYDDDTTWDLSNENFLKTFKVHASNTYTATSLYNSKKGSLCTQSTRYSAGYHDGAKFAGGEVAGVTYVNTNDVLSSIGMLKNSRKAGDIYQLETKTGDEKTITVNKKSFVIPNKTLQEGFQLCASTTESVVDWEADFTEVKYYNGAAWEDVGEVDIYLSYEPFSDKLSSTDLIQCEGSTSDYVTTVSKKAKLKWKQTKNSLVYMKCVPHFTDSTFVDSKDWWIKLDLTYASKYFNVTVE